MIRISVWVKQQPNCSPLLFSVLLARVSIVTGQRSCSQLRAKRLWPSLHRRTSRSDGLALPTAAAQDGPSVTHVLLGPPRREAAEAEQQGSLELWPLSDPHGQGVAWGACGPGKRTDQMSSEEPRPRLWGENPSQTGRSVPGRSRLTAAGGRGRGRSPRGASW